MPSHSTDSEYGRVKTRAGLWCGDREGRRGAGLTRFLEPGHWEKPTNPCHAALCHCQFSQKTCARDSQSSYLNSAPPTQYHPALSQAGWEWVGRLVFEPVSSKFPESGHRLQFSQSSESTGETPQKAKSSYSFGVTTHLNGGHGHSG